MLNIDMNNESLYKIKEEKRKALNEEIEVFLRNGGKINKIKEKKRKENIGVKVKTGKGLNPTVNDAGEGKYTTNEGPYLTSYETD